MRPIPRMLVAASAVALAAAVATSAAAAAKKLPKTKMVSVRLRNSPPGRSAVTGAVSVSADGRFVAFSGDASDLTPGDSNGKPDVFVRDLKKNRTRLVSSASGGSNGGDAPSNGPVLSANGRFVVFISAATNLVANDTNGLADAFVKDLKTGTTTLVSAKPDGSAAGGVSSVGISADGRIVVFMSNAAGIAGNDVNGTHDVFVRDMTAGTTTLVSRNAAGTAAGNSFSTFPAVTPSGLFVVFKTSATDMGVTDANGGNDIVVRQLANATSVVVSVDPTGTHAGNGDCDNPRITPDGAHVTFESTSSDLVTGDQNGAQDVFVRDVAAGTTTLVSRNKAGTGSAAGSSGTDGLSDDGRFVAFETDAADVVDGDTNAATDIFLRDLQTGVTKLVSVNAAGTGPGDGPSDGAIVSGDGRYVVFASQATNLVAADTNGQSDLFVRDMKTGVTSLISSNASGKATANAAAGSPVLAANNRTLVFTSDASDLVAKDTDGAFDVFVRPIR